MYETTPGLHRTVLQLRKVQMFYCDGIQVRRGDRVSLGGKDGMVVLSVDTDEYSEGFPKAQWAGVLAEGVLIECPGLGLVHCYGRDEDLSLLARGTEPCDE